MDRNTEEVISTPTGERFDREQAAEFWEGFVGVDSQTGQPLPKTRAEALFNVYNEQGPNPWKTFDGRDVPRWPEISEQVRAKWSAVAAAQEAELTGLKAERDQLASEVGEARGGARRPPGAVRAGAGGDHHPPRAGVARAQGTG